MNTTALQFMFAGSLNENGELNKVFKNDFS